MSRNHYDVASFIACDNLLGCLHLLLWGSRGMSVLPSFGPLTVTWSGRSAPAWSVAGSAAPGTWFRGELRAF